MTHPNPHVAELIAAFQSLLAGRNVAETPSAATILIFAWMDQVRRDAETACATYPEEVEAAKHYARCIHNDLCDSIVMRQPRVPMVDRVMLPGAYKDGTEFRWPHDAVLDFAGNMGDAVPLWVHYFRAISDVEHIKRETKEKREGFV